MYIFSSYSKEKSMSLIKINNNIVQTLSTFTVESPSFCINGDGFIYSYEKAPKMILKSYFIDNNKICLKDSFELGGSSITHLVYSEVNHVLYGCSYQDGTYFAIKVDHGMFKEVLNFSKQIDDDRLSRCHCVFLNSDETILGIVNIALDAIYLYDISNGKMLYKDIINLPKNSGPRHAIFNHDDSIIYVVTEYSNEVFVVDYQKKSLIQRISTTSFDGETYGATLLLNKKETTLYASNRGDETIAYYNILKDKTLKHVDNFPVEGKHSRHMIMSNDEKYIISCNMNSNNITFINTITKKVDFNITYDKPSCAIDLSALQK